jgi:hypothetical protein
MAQIFVFDNQGRVREPSMDEYALADEDTKILSYTHGTTQDGRPFYAYVAVYPSKYKEFHRMTATKEPFAIEDYGTIVEGAFEVAPTQEVVQHMHAMGFDEQFEEKQKQEAKQELAAFMEHHELDRIQDIVSMLKKRGTTTK